MKVNRAYIALGALVAGCASTILNDRAILNMGIISISVVYLACLVSRMPGEQKQNPDAEELTSKDAALMPAKASFFLFGFFLILKIFPWAINAAFRLYFTFLGCLAGVEITGALFKAKEESLLTLKFPFLDFDKDPEDTSIASYLKFKKIEVVWKFSWAQIATLVGMVGIGGTYLAVNHWLLNNFFGLVLTVVAIGEMKLGSVKTGLIMMWGLFFFDIFWVFGSSHVFGENVMVSVATKLNVPIKLMFPNGRLEKPFNMLGLGDLIIPGIFLAALRFYDLTSKKNDLNKETWLSNSSPYLEAGMLSYAAGMALTVLVMMISGAAQPALLYLVPCVVITTLARAYSRGELKELLEWQATPSKAEKSE